jgi:dTDP-4-dehydrorhamnose 3,5-epimerase
VNVVPSGTRTVPSNGDAQDGIRNSRSWPWSHRPASTRERFSLLFQETKLPGAYIVSLELREDQRGFFARSWCRDEFREAGIEIDIAQGNVSFSRMKGTLRGMHYQKPPYQEAKLVRCNRGAIYDAIVDLRPESPTFGDWVGVELTQSNNRMLYVPQGFGHGFETLEDDTEVTYLVSQVYAPGSEGGVRYDDPAIGIEWPLKPEVISDKDLAWPAFALDGFEFMKAGVR